MYVVLGTVLLPRESFSYTAHSILCGFIWLSPLPRRHCYGLNYMVVSFSLVLVWWLLSSPSSPELLVVVTVLDMWHVLARCLGCRKYPWVHPQPGTLLHSSARSFSRRSRLGRVSLLNSMQASIHFLLHLGVHLLLGSNLHH